MDEAGVLDSFHTTISTNPDNLWMKILPKTFQNELLRRKFPLGNHLIRSYPFREIVRLSSRKIGITELTKHETGKFSVDAVYRSLDRQVAKNLGQRPKSKFPDAVYAYEDGAVDVFNKAKELNIPCIYDLPKGYYKAERDLLGKERDANPAWASTLAGFKDSQEKVDRKDLELERADHIIVASSFTKKTLEYYSGDLPQISVVPYGFPPVIANRDYYYKGDRKLKLLFVGSLSQLKGLANVLEAVERLKDSVELTIVGRKSTEECIPLNEGLKKHRYMVSLPHNKVLQEMAAHDVFLFPSLFEGFGLVVTEAMSQGTPVITTARTCGADIINHHEDGWIVKPGSTDDLVRQITLILEKPDSVKNAGKAAVEKAKSRPWHKYGTELVETLYDITKD